MVGDACDSDNDRDKDGVPDEVLVISLKHLLLDDKYKGVP